MKKLILSAFFALSIFNFNATAQKKTPVTEEVKVAIDLNQVKDDKVMVTIIPPILTSNEIVFHIPKTVPGQNLVDGHASQ